VIGFQTSSLRPRRRGQGTRSHHWNSKHPICDYDRVVRRNCISRRHLHPAIGGTSDTDKMTRGMQDDRRKPLETISRLHRLSLVSELRVIQKHALPIEKAHEWAKNLLCLRYDPSLGPHFRRIYNRSTSRKFLAVSWTREPSVWEDPKWGKYSILPTRGGRYSKQPTQPEALHVRDCVLDRVINYMTVHKLDTFWIDKACIDQRHPKNKSKAINSMDLVYQKADKTVGLLSRQIYSSNGALMLAGLLDGCLALKDDLGRFHFRPGVCHSTIHKVLRILQDLIGDKWWKRAWIYQEEYLSGKYMDLLIPVDLGIQVPLPYGRVPGEFCVQATRFREQVTIFLLACTVDDRTRRNALIARMLTVVERYNITLEGFSGVWKPMSARIFANIAHREVKDAWDTLAITANVCAYLIRLNAEALRLKGCSLSMSLLAQFFLNGEISFNIRAHKRMRHNLLDCNISEFLEEIQPEFQDLPIVAQKLTFLKHCRLPSTRILPQGLGTKGFIWFLPKHANIDTGELVLPKVYPARREHLEKHPWESLELKRLVEELERRDQALLGAELRRYLEKRRTARTSPALAFMDIMACELFQAISRGLTLRCGFLPGRPGSGIFIPRRWELDQPMHVLTTWQPPKRGTDEVGNAVSLKVGVCANRVVDPKRWINGMVFFSSNTADDVILGWPRSWMRQPAEANQ